MKEYSSTVLSPLNSTHDVLYISYHSYMNVDAEGFRCDEYIPRLPQSF